jgi:broad specificity phosphatase PhoE
MIVMFRHLPTVHDANGIYTDWDHDPPLLPLAASTIEPVREEIQEFIRKFCVKCVYASDNPRGENTLRTLFPKGNPLAEIIKDGRLNNIKQPEWSGKQQSEVVQSPLYRQWHTQPTKTVFPNGESLLDVTRRVESFLSEIRNRSILVFSHTTPMQVLLCKVLSIEYDHIWSFKFDHFAFTMVYRNILLRYNSTKITDVNLSELKLPPDAKSDY